MLVKVNVVLKSLAGETLKDANPQGEAIDATLQNAIVNALLAPLQQGKSEAGVEKLKKYELAMKVHKADEVELSAEEITLIKERVGEIFGPLVVGQVYNLLEGKEIESNGETS